MSKPSNTNNPKAYNLKFACFILYRYAKYEDIKGDYSKGEPPLPIPNREVKPLSADGTAL